MISTRYSIAALFIVAASLWVVGCSGSSDNARADNPTSAKVQQQADEASAPSNVPQDDEDG